MKYKINWENADGVFAVPDFVVDDYIKLANGKAVKVLLYVLRFKCADIEKIGDISAALGISAEDAEDAFSYWEQVGLMRKENAPVPVKTTEFVPEAAAVVPVQTPIISAAREKERVTKMLSPKEIAERIEASDELNFLFAQTETLIGRVLNNTEQRSLLWIHDYYSLGTDLILMIIEFSRSVNKANVGFIERTAQNWNEKGISTHDQAAAEIIRLQNYYSLAGQVVKRLELNRALTPSECKFVNAWSGFGFDIDVILYAYEKTVNATGKAAFSYMNKILEGWNANNLRTIAEIDRFNEEYSASKNFKAQARSDSKSAEEHSYNLDLLLNHALNNTPQ